MVSMMTSGSKPMHANPVYDSYFADPFVFKAGDSYFAIGTGAQEAVGQTIGKVFPILQSKDFLQWQFASNALLRPDPSLGGNFWAPAVAEAEGKFFLYYSVGHGDKNHQLRVATGDSPQGPYSDSGTVLLDPVENPFAIDPHPFRDEDGQWYLFYASDFLDTVGGHRAGTALKVSRMVNMTTLEDNGRTVLRARYDWQRFQSHRQMYDSEYDWHTLEGPCVVKRQEKYFCFYSGGRWDTQNYGVDYGVADHPMGPYSDDGSNEGARVLRTIPGSLLGPGHNTITTGPDGSTDFIVYHAWDKRQTARKMFIDKLAWQPEGPRCVGPTWGDHWNHPQAVEA